MIVKSDIQIKLTRLKASLEKKYPLKAMAIFGSYSRNDHRADSDVDILVEFNGKIGVGFFKLADELEAALGLKVDLVSRNGIKPKYFEAIKDDLIYV